MEKKGDETYLRVRKVLISCLILSIILCNLCYVRVNASEPVIEQLDVLEDTSEYDALNEYLVERGREIIANPYRRSSVALAGLVRMVQSDSRWSSVMMYGQDNNGNGINATIGKEGCCLTSFTMVRNLISSVSETPKQVYEILGANAYVFKWYSAASTYGYDIVTARANDNGISNESARLNVIGAIDQYSRPAIVGLKNTAGNTHFVVAYGYTSEGDVIIADPASTNHTRISQYYAGGYFVYRIYVYDN